MARLVPDKEALLFYEEEMKGASIDGQKDVLLSARKQKQVVPAHRNEEEDDIAAESESEEFDDEFDGSGGGDSSSSAGASDLEGMPVASASHDDAGPSETKRSKQGTAQSITEEGASSKIGIVFSRILEKRAKQGVLAGSKSIQKRRREDEAEVALKHEARQQRQQLTSRNHKIVLPKGHDPTQDAREKTLMTVATKGVVQLFNALTKAQQARWNSEVQGEKTDKADKASKAALLKVLKPPSKPAEEAGWKVLQKGFTGFKESKMKMKDFDRQESSGSDVEDKAPDPALDGDAVEGW